MIKDYMNGTVVKTAPLANVKELRIGNIISLDGRPIKVTSSVLKKIESLKLLSGYEAIVLTGEVFRKFGFYFGDMDQNDFRLNGWYQFGDLIIHYYSDGEYRYEHGPANIRYAHQLQNLYFAVYGDELAYEQ